MKKLSYIILLALFGQTLSAQYMIIGKDSLELQTYKKDNLYGLQNSGVENTLKSTQDFLLLQQFAQEKRADTMAYFKNKLAEKEGELRDKFFYPRAVMDPLLNDYMLANRTELKVQVFMVEKSDTDKTDYRQVYNDVKSGKMKFQDAVAKYMKAESKPLYLKPGSFDNQMYSEFQKMTPGTFTKFYDTPSVYAFAQLLDSRPSLGYIVFGTLSYPKDANSEKIKNDVYAALSSGKKFQEVTKLYGSTDDERNSGGIVVGSPTLPEEAYNALKGKKAGEYTQPILLGDKYFIFNVYSLEPYAVTDKNKSFFEKEMMRSQYADVAFDKLVSYAKQTGYKEFPDYLNVKKSYQSFSNIKNQNALLFQYNQEKFTVADLKKMLDEKVKNASTLPAEQWTQLLDMINSQFVYKSYSEAFPNQKNIKTELEAYKKNLYSEFVFSEWLKKQVDTHPEWLTEYYNKNKSKFFWERRAKGRVAILADEKMVPEIKKQINDAKNWDALQKKYYGVLNDKKQILAHFETGDMSENADVFTKYNVPFKKGLFDTKMGERSLVIAIDEILPPTQMTEAESVEMLKDAVQEEKLNEIIAQQRAKTNIVVQPAFRKDLEQNFKK